MGQIELSAVDGPAWRAVLVSNTQMQIMEREARRMEQEKSYRDVFECSPDAILIIEGDRFVDCNPAALRMLRYADKKALLKLRAHPAEISPPNQPNGRDSFEMAEEYLGITFESGSHTFEWTHLCGDGEHLLVEVQLTVVRHGEKPVVHVVWRDISERKRLEAELRQAQRLEAVGRLAGGVAHDFNNLLLVIISHSELLEGEFQSGQPDPKHVTGIRSAADRAVDLTRQLLAFSRGQPVQPRVTDLNFLVERLGGLLERLIGEHIKLSLKLQHESVAVFADPSQLEQVVVNLAVNARDAMPSGGTLAISVDRYRVGSREPLGQLPPGDYVRLSVADSGVGMTQQELERAFDPFYTTKALGKGTGLGMATVHAVAVQNGGLASIESTLAQGTTVQVLFPMSRRDPVSHQAEPRPNPQTGGGETILLVEDEQAIRDLFKSTLTAKGYRTLTAADGQEALDLVARWDKPIDLLVTDVVMPRISGPELVRRLSTVLTDLRVLYMSGYTEEDLRDLPDEKRAGLLKKPFPPSQLEAEIRRILDAD